MTGRICDLLHELRIWLAKKIAMELHRNGLHELARLMWRRHADLIAMRSNRQVERMERRMGIN